MDLKGIGFVVAVASAIFNGSFAAFMKIPAVARRQPDPIVFNFYVTLGVFLSSWLVIPFYDLDDKYHLSSNDVEFDGYGVIAGALFVGAVLFSFLAIPLIGLSIGQCVWGGSAVLIAFLWGVAGPKEVSNPVKSVPLSVVAVALLLIGIICVVLADKIARTAAQLCGCSSTYEVVASGEEEGLIAVGNENIPTQPHPSQPPSDETAPTNKAAFVAGIGCALAVGLFGGSVLVPMSFSGLKGISFIPSFGIGALAGGVLVMFGRRVQVYCKGDEWTGWHLMSPVLPAGIASGTMWNLGNICQVWAQAYAGLAYGVAYPILQCALVVAGLLGIFCFREITDRGHITAFFGASAVIIGGATLLGLYGPQSD